MALDFVASAIANCVGNLATECASSYVAYFFHFGRNVKQFKDQRKALQLKKDLVESDVAEAKRQTEVIEKNVEEWLKKAEKELGEAQSLEEEIERNKCFNWCPSCGWRYCLSIKVAKKTLYIPQLLAEACNFQRVGRRPPLQGIEFLLSKDFMAFESSISAFNGIMKALNSDGVNMIGLYGMPGVGKTTLAEVVLKQATEQKLFDKVVSVTVSQTPDPSEIRARIAELFGLTFEANTVQGKAEELWRRLKGEKKILMILDDVWKELELQTLGIPFGEHEGCKILLTTRLQRVCIQMKCQETFELKILSEDEAWALFKDKADVEDDSPTLNVAKEVARECDGLPLAIVTVAKALKGRDLNGWMVANQRLKDSRPLDDQYVCLYSRLKLSYDYLEDDDVKSCFLFCSLFPEDYEIPIEKLVICGIGQGLFRNININSLEVSRREIYEALTKLQQFGLLFEIDDRDKIKMHDVVRDFAHWITSRGENMFMVKNELTEWPESGNFGCYTAISLWNFKIDNFPDRLEFAELKILILKGDNHRRVPSTFFEGMKTLQVLYLDGVEFSMEALQFLTNLRTLYIALCELENFSSLKNLKKLELLHLDPTNIHELPEEVVELHRLKSLYIFFSGYGDGGVPPNLISRLTSLQELRLIHKTTANLSELNSLSHLSALTLRVSTKCFQENFVFPKLQSYNIAVNTHLEFSVKHDSRILRISHFSSSLNAFKELFRNVQKLTLVKVMEHKNVVPNVDQWGLNELTSLKLYSCDNLECLIDTTQEQSPTTALSNLAVPLSNLRSLKLYLLPTLESIWKGRTHHVGLPTLKDVKVEGCEKLKSIFPPCLIESLLHLEEVEIRNCINLEQVFTFDKEMAKLEVAPLSNLRSLKLHSLPTLESVWKESTHHVGLPSLKNVNVDGCDKLKSIFSPCLIESLLHLEEVEISNCINLEQVFVFDKEMAKLEVAPLSNLRSLKLHSLPTLESIWKEPTHHVVPLANLSQLSMISLPTSKSIWKEPTHHISLRSLNEVTIQDCHELKSIFSPCLAQSLLHLKKLKILDCENLEQVFAFDKEMAELEDVRLYGVDHAIALPCLQELGLFRLINLSSEKFLISTPSLEMLTVCTCPKLTNLTIQKEDNGQIQLKVHGRIKDLCLGDLFEVQIIWKDVAQIVTLENLTILKVFDCKRLRYIFSPTTARSLSQLKSLDITDCDELDQIIAEDQVCSSSNSDPQPTSFPNLTRISVMCCKKLKCLFLFGFARCLLKLEELIVYKNSKLEQVFELEDEAEAIAEKEIKFDQLKKLSLVELPSLVDFCPRGYHFVLPALKYLKVAECPKMTTGFFIDSKKYVHAKIETPQLVEQSAIEGIGIAQNVVHTKNINWGRDWRRDFGDDGLPPWKEEL